jgi:hypothetical protein
MASEQFTESIVLQEMRCTLGENAFGQVFPQGDAAQIVDLEKLLKKAGGKPALCPLEDYSKGGGGKAKPEFIITFNDYANTILVVECKKSNKQHVSESLDSPKSYAVDGVLYYTKFLKDLYNVAAIAVSGTKKENLKVSTFYWEKGHDAYKEFPNVNILLEPLNYLKYINGEKIAIAYSIEDIRKTAIDMSDKLRVAKVTANNKPIFIAGILIALQDKSFVSEYIYAASLESLIDALRSAITRVLKKTKVAQDRIESMLNTFNDAASLHHFQTTAMPADNSLRWYIQELDMKIKPMMNHSDSSIDALGEFYQEFIKFSNGDDGKALGIVLPPSI